MNIVWDGEFLASWGNKSRFVSLVKGRSDISGFHLFSPQVRGGWWRLLLFFKNTPLVTTAIWCQRKVGEARSCTGYDFILLYLALSSSYLVIIQMGKMKGMRRKRKHEEGSEKICRKVIGSWVLGRQRNYGGRREKQTESDDGAGNHVQV